MLPNFKVPSLGDHLEHSTLKKSTPVESENVTNNPQQLGNSMRSDVS